jgi:hypothetical protein
MKKSEKKLKQIVLNSEEKSKYVGIKYRNSVPLNKKKLIYTKLNDYLNDLIYI